MAKAALLPVGTSISKVARSEPVSFTPAGIRSTKDDSGVNLHICASMKLLEEPTQHVRNFSSDRVGDSAGLAAIAHDLNNVFSIISMATELLSGDLAGPAARRMLDLIQAQVIRGNKLAQKVSAQST